VASRRRRRTRVKLAAGLRLRFLPVIEWTLTPIR